MCREDNTLDWLLERYVERAWIGFFGLKGLLKCFCKCGNEPSVFTKYREYVEWLRNCFMELV